MTNTPRPRRRVRAVLVGVVLSLVAASLPARAGGLIHTSYASGWLTNTVLWGTTVNGQKLKAPISPDPTDPPYVYSGGQIHYLMTRWTNLCTESPNQPVVVVTDASGIEVASDVTVERVPGSPLFTVVRWTVDDPAYPHGLAAGRADERGGGAPYQARFEVHFLKINGQCDEATTGVAGPTYIGIDRRLPPAPTITAPTSLTTVARTAGCAEPPCQPLQVPAPIRGPVVVRGKATDPVTRPFDELDPSLIALETSGVKAVIVTLYRYSPPTDQETLDTLGTAEFVRSFTWLNPNCDAGYPIPAGNGDTTGIKACSSQIAEWRVDITEALQAGQSYGIAAYTIDLAGFRSPVPQTMIVNPDNTRGGDSPPKAFTFLG